MHTKQFRGAERRTEPRVLVTEEVRLRQSSALAGSFLGRLMDTAAHGFRARHNCLTLTSGQLVDFAYRGRQGLACTVWTRIVDGEAETGFRILPEPDT
ncbi:MAG: hypothetical protein LAQ69_06365 [Acidobacteriia bacterium]|nr:hypothetical protein [Terriglobia bacterium]